ncbi:hypothetical protein BV058_00117B, partial [Haemophilus influenzae]
FSNCNE